MAKARLASRLLAAEFGEGASSGQFVLPNASTPRVALSTLGIRDTDRSAS